jgi:hypothetical protein
MWCRGAALASWSYGCRFAPILYVLKAFAQYFFNIPCKFMNSFQVVLEKIFMNNFLLSDEIPYAFPKLFGNFSWVLGRCKIPS